MTEANKAELSASFPEHLDLNMLTDKDWKNLWSIRNDRDAIVHYCDNILSEYEEAMDELDYDIITRAMSF